MKKVKIGASLEAFGLPLRRAIQAASRLGISGVRFNASGDLGPDQLSQSGRREFRHVLRANDLELTAVGCPLRYGLNVAENLEPRLDFVKQVMSLAFDLGPRIAIVQAGKIPEEDNDPQKLMLKESLLALGNFGDRHGSTLALETGLESGETLSTFLEQLDTGSLGVNFDPANLLINGFRPLEDVRALSGKIVHVQAKDARKAGPHRGFSEVPLGHGDIDWMMLAGNLEEMDYQGYVVVHSELGNLGVKQVEEGVGFLRRFLG